MLPSITPLRRARSTGRRLALGALPLTTAAIALTLVFQAFNPAARALDAYPPIPAAESTVNSNAWADNTDDACVILLHGMGRTDFSMLRLESALRREGYAVANVHYDSRDYAIATLAERAIKKGLELCAEQDSGRIHFATHSLGGILVRAYMHEHELPQLGRVVMMAPPNQGSEIIDVFGDFPGFELFGGEPAQQLGTNSDSVPQQLGPVDFEVGVIAGTRSLNPFLSMALPDRDDGKVTVKNTKVEGMQDFIELPFSHTFIMQRQESIDQVLHFLAHGVFNHSGAS